MINILHTNEIERNVRDKIIHSEGCFFDLIIDEYMNMYLLNIPIIERMGTACHYFNKIQGKKLLPEHYTLDIPVIIVQRGEKHGKMQRTCIRQITLGI